MSAEAFIDTDVFIYQLEATDARKAAIADRLIGDAIDTGSACISFQVVQECINTVLRKRGSDAQKWLENGFEVSPGTGDIQRDLGLRFVSPVARHYHHSIRISLLRRTHSRRSARSGVSPSLQRRPSTWPENRRPDHRKPLRLTSRGIVGNAAL